VLEVRRLRLAREWNQTELAYHAGLAPSVISQIENGKRDPTSRTLRKLAKALEVEVGDLFPKGQAPLPDFEDERRAEVKGPDESVWGAPQNRPGPEEQMPEPAGRRINVEIQDDLSNEPARVEITYEGFLDVLRRRGLTRRAAEEAFEELQRISA
jgi:transcriptional regulator with XRE-family HTH domain